MTTATTVSTAPVMIKKIHIQKLPRSSENFMNYQKIFTKFINNSILNITKLQYTEQES